MLRRIIRQSAMLFRPAKHRSFHQTLRKPGDEQFTPSMNKLDRDVSNLKNDFHALKSDFHDVKLDVSGIRSDIQELGSTLQVSMTGHAKAQQEQFTHFYVRCLFGVLGLSGVIVASSLIMPFTEGKRLENEVKRQALLRRGVDKAVVQMKKEEECERKQ